MAQCVPIHRVSNDLIDGFPNRTGKRNMWRNFRISHLGGFGNKARTRFGYSISRSVSFLAVAFLATSAPAEVVVANLDYNNQFSGNTQSGAVAVGTAGDFWNASATFGGFQGTETPSGNTGGTAPFGSFELLNTVGMASGVSYQMTFINDGIGFNSAFENLGAVPATSAANLLGDYAFAGGADAADAMNFELSGLTTDTTYSLYLYGNGDAMGQGATWTLDGVSATSAFDGTSTIDEGGEYAKFTFNTGAGTTQAFAATELGGNIAINGFQLTQITAIPEPSSAAFVAFAGLLGVIRRRRRNL